MNTEANKQITKPKTTANAGPKQSKRDTWFIVITFLIAVMACCACAYLWYLQVRAQQTQTQALTDLQRSLRTLDEHPTITEFKQHITEQNARFAQQLHDLSMATNTLEASVSKTLDLTGRGHREWVLSEVEYLIRMAHTQAQLMRNTEAAINALVGADERIASLTDPRYIPVRKEIASEITALKSLLAPDIDGALLRLSMITRRLAGLPLASVAYYPNNAVSDELTKDETTLVATPTPESVSWYSAAFKAIKNLVGFRHDAKPSKETLSRKNVYYMDQLLRLEIESARQAALRLDKDDFEYRLTAIKALLDKHYDQTHSQVITLKQDIVALQQLPVFDKLPSLTGSLEALRKTMNTYPPNKP